MMISEREEVLTHLERLTRGAVRLVAPLRHIDILIPSPCLASYVSIYVNYVTIIRYIYKEPGYHLRVTP